MTTLRTTDDDSESLFVNDDTDADREDDSKSVIGDGDTDIDEDDSKGVIGDGVAVLAVLTPLFNYTNKLNPDH